MNKKTFYLSIDFEEWFHIPFMKPYISEETKNITFCDKLDKFFDQVNSQGIKTTIFVVGEIAEKNKEKLIKYKENGNVIACHSLMHSCYKEMSKEQFINDVKQAKEKIEESIGEKINGFRAPMFSASKEQLSCLKELGFKFDSSAISSSSNPFYNKISKKEWNGDEELKEYRIPVRGNVSLGGGGYFRAMPLWLYKIKLRKFMKKNDEFVFFLHPYEIAPAKFPGFIKGAMSYGYFRYNKGLNSVMKKFWKLIKWLKKNDFEFKTME